MSKGDCRGKGKKPDLEDVDEDLERQRPRSSYSVGPHSLLSEKLLIFSHPPDPLALRESREDHEADEGDGNGDDTVNDKEPVTHHQKEVYGQLLSEKGALRPTRLTTSSLPYRPCLTGRELQSGGRQRTSVRASCQA
jgi:hypothetical protein